MDIARPQGPWLRVDSIIHGYRVVPNDHGIWAFVRNGRDYQIYNPHDYHLSIIIVS